MKNLLPTTRTCCLYPLPRFRDLFEGIPESPSGVAISLYERCGAVNAINDVGNKVTGRRVPTAGLMLLSHSRLLLHPKPAVSRGKMPR
jgi:hypothetical protein